MDEKMNKLKNDIDTIVEENISIHNLCIKALEKNYQKDRMIYRMFMMMCVLCIVMFVSVVIYKI